MTSCKNKAPEPREDAYSLIINTSWNARYDGLASGWQLDNRGGTPRSELIGGYGTLEDIRDDAGTALIREFNKISRGVVDLTSKVSVDGKDGAYLEYRNDSGASVYRLEVIDGAWNSVIGETNTKLADAISGEYVIRVSLDLNNGRARTSIDAGDFAVSELALSGDELNLADFRYATTESAKTTFSPLYTQATANYAVNEDFTHPTVGWSCDKSSVNGGALKINKDGSASVEFEPLEGTSVVEFLLTYAKAANLTLSVRSGENEAVRFNSSKDGFSVGDTLVYPTEYSSINYRVRLELDTENSLLKTKINGRVVAETELSVDSIDSLMFTNDGLPTSIDNVKVFRTFERDDYVPEPVKPAGEEKYLVGMNVCSLWRNGTHYDWACISPYDDRVPVLGYYDEGVPETADWEIKYLVEHGIDFQAFCVYFKQGTNPLVPNLESHLYDGFMNAKYSDLTKFCVIWECQNAGSPTTLDEWKDVYVPYFIENYFKDPRHVTVNNKPILCVFGPNQLSSRLGGNANVKKAFDYLDEEIKKLGFDGMIYLCCGSSTTALAEMGFDGCYAYGWGSTGYLAEMNVGSIVNSAEQGSVYTVPTVSVGYNSIPWHGVRYPMLSVEDSASVHSWIKDEYLPKYAKEDWQKNFVMLSTWNEYGEGTFLMPTTDEKGFGYIDVIREAYTDEKADPSLNTIPTEAQRERINRLYPQEHHLLRRNGTFDPIIPEKSLETVYTIDFAERTDTRGGDIDELKFGDFGVSGVSNSRDPKLSLPSVEAINLDEIDYIRIAAKLEAYSVMHLYFITEDDKTWNENKAADTLIASEDEELTYYYIDADSLKGFTGKLAGIRLDPSKTDDTWFEVKSIEFMKDTSKVKSPKLTIDGKEYTFHKLLPMKEVGGELCVPFDPTTGMDFALNIFHEWDKDKGELTLNFIGHTLVFTVGSDKYTLDGEEISLGYTLEAYDALPLIPLKRLCEAVGYGYEFDGEVVKITTSGK